MSSPLAEISHLGLRAPIASTVGAGEFGGDDPADGESGEPGVT